MSDDSSHGGRASSPLGHILSFLAIGFTLVLVGIFLVGAVSSPGDTATALFEVSNESDGLLGGTRLTNQEFEIIKKTQLALLKSNYVLTAAIRPPGIASLSVLAGKDDPVKWLQDNLVVDFPQNGEILSISLTGSELPEDLVRLVDAVAKAYKEEVVNVGRQRQTARRDLLARNLENLNKDVKRKLEEYLDIAKEIGSSSSAQGDLLQQIAMKQLDRIEDEIIRLDTSLAVEVGGDSTKRDAIRLRVDQLTRQKKGLTAELASRIERSPDLEIRQEELEQLQEISNDMSAKLQSLDIDVCAPDRIRQIQPAVIARD